jgi:hypothetical protein
LNALNNPQRSGPAPQIAVTQTTPAYAPLAIPTAPNTANAHAFQAAAKKIATNHPEMLKQPGWENVNSYLATTGSS